MIIRTLGFYQPFCSLMFHGKIETRWVRKGKKPPFPLGRYLFYSTKIPANTEQLNEWCNREILLSIVNTLEGDATRFNNGYALGVGDLVEVRLMTKEDESSGFVKFIGEKEVFIEGTGHVDYVQWALIFENLETIDPVRFDAGKQGVGILKQPYLSKLGY